MSSSDPRATARLPSPLCPVCRGFGDKLWIGHKDDHAAAAIACSECWRYPNPDPCAPCDAAGFCVRDGACLDGLDKIFEEAASAVRTNGGKRFEPCRYACSAFPNCGCEVEELSPPTEVSGAMPSRATARSSR